MTREEAIKALERAEDYVGIHYVNGVEDPYISPYLLKAIDFAVAAIREQEQRRWIPVTDRLPEDDHDVLIVGSGSPVKNVRLENSLEIARFSKDEGWILECWPDWETPIVTHWMPLPEPPKGE